MKQLKLVITGTVILLSSLIVIVRTGKDLANQSINGQTDLQQDGTELSSPTTGGMMVPFFSPHNLAY